MKESIAADILKKGGVVIFPTETVYGIGASIYKIDAVKRIFKIKNRPFSDPLIVHIYSIKELKKIAYVNKLALKLIKKFWPGPLTVVLKKKKIVADIITGGLDTVAVRMPSNKIIRRILKHSGPVAAPSVNKFGRTPATKLNHIDKEILKSVDMYIDGGATEYGIESTVVYPAKNKIIVLRPGAVTIEELKKLCKNVCLKEDPLKASPGQFKKHYAPEKPMYIVEKLKPDKDAAAITFYKKVKGFKKVIVLSKNRDLSEASRRLYDAINKLDRLQVKKIYVEKMPFKLHGVAIMDRLKKAAT